MNPTYNTGDLLSLAYAKTISARLRADPLLLSVGINNICRWKSQGVDAPAYQEWLVIIEQGLDSVCFVLEAETEEGQRLRSSSPFPGILTQEERMTIWNQYHPKAAA